MIGWDDEDNYKAPSSFNYWNRESVKEKIEQNRKVIESHPYWINYPIDSKDRKTVEKAYESIKKYQDACQHSFKVEVLFQLAQKKCIMCGFEDRSYDPIKD